mmetsp:Transcript_11042/g.21319  ORF Transcript_11042/g.21319 Transcript_11042/m.21319 type:complete len:113 (-) Transcript_11042:249-587(-)
MRGSTHILRRRFTAACLYLHVCLSGCTLLVMTKCTLPACMKNDEMLCMKNSKTFDVCLFAFCMPACPEAHCEGRYGPLFQVWREVTNAYKYQLAQTHTRRQTKRQQEERTIT